MDEVIQHKTNKTSTITLTPKATARFLQFIAKDKHATGIRLWLKQSGCSGLSYQFSCVSQAQEQDIVILLENNCYLYVDKASYPWVKGMTIDYLKEGLNYRLVFNNPNQTGECGCGESFTIAPVEE